MEDYRARLAMSQRDADGTAAIGDPAEMNPDDPLGDEAAFPSTWQHLAGSEGNGRD